MYVHVYMYTWLYYTIYISHTIRKQAQVEDPMCISPPKKYGFTSRSSSFVSKQLAAGNGMNLTDLAERGRLGLGKTTRTGRLKVDVDVDDDDDDDDDDVDDGCWIWVQIHEDIED